MPCAILFDLDDTLIDRDRTIARYAESFHREFADALAPIAASRIAELIRIADGQGYRSRAELFQDLLLQLPWRGSRLEEDLATHWESRFPISSVARVGLHETLAALHAEGIRLGIVTNGTVRRQQPKIDTLRIGSCFSTVVISEAVGVKKPDARIFERALADVGCEASRTWFVGDHPVNDVIGAAAAGCQAIWLRGFHPWPSEHPAPRWQIDALSDLVTLVKQERIELRG